MPYIPQGDRLKLDAFLDGTSRNVDTKGELTYALTRLVLGYVDRQGKSYDSYSDVLGCLTATTHEVYRTEVGKYEDAKKIQNGPIVRHGPVTLKGAPVYPGHAIGSRRCPCGSGADRCEGANCIGSEGTTDGGW